MKSKEIKDLARSINTKELLSTEDLIARYMTKDLDRSILQARQRAIAEKYHKVTIHGKIKAIAEQSNPLQTKCEIFITDYLPNGNKQAVKQSESKNIIASAKNAPLKINFDGVDYSGHVGAIPIGSIYDVFERDNAIYGYATIWDELFKDVSDVLRSKEWYTSWEMYYEDSEVDKNGVEWLNGIVFAASCIVDAAAYGSRALGKIV